MNKVTLQDCVDFHGDFCGGVTIGWIMGNFAMEKLGVKKGDSLYMETEFQNCMNDALQMVTGCTVGKGNLKIRDIGKRTLILADCTTGRAVKVKAVPFGTKEEMLAADPSEICSYEFVDYDIPKVIKKKRNYISCAICGEEFAEDCAVVSNGKIICPDCAEH